MRKIYHKRSSHGGCANLTRNAFQARKVGDGENKLIRPKRVEKMMRNARLFGSFSP